MRSLHLALGLSLALWGAPALAQDTEAPTTSETVEVVATDAHGDEMDPESWEQLRRRFGVAQGLYGVGAAMFVGGGITIAVGGSIFMVGLIPAIFGEPTMMLTGMVVMGVGAGVVIFGVPVAVTGGMMGATLLRRNGVKVMTWPGWVSVGGLALGVTGIAVQSGELIFSGALLAVVAGGTQAIIGAAAMGRFREEHDLAVRVVPVVAPGHTGLVLTGSF